MVILRSPTGLPFNSVAGRTPPLSNLLILLVTHAEYPSIATGTHKQGLRSLRNGVKEFVTNNKVPSTHYCPRHEGRRLLKAGKPPGKDSR